MFPFIALEEDGDESGESDDTTYPALDVRLAGPSGVELETPLVALVDSGADGSTIPIEYAEALGVSLTQCLKKQFDSAGGEATEFIWEDAPVLVRFDDTQEVLITASFSPTPYILLGRNDFFEKYRVTFDQRESYFSLETYE